MARKRLGELLLERGLVTPEQLQKALNYQRQTGTRLGAALLTLGFLDEMQLCLVLGKALGLRAVRMPPRPEQLDWKALSLLRAHFCDANDLFPLAIHAQDPNRRRLIVAMADPLNIPAIEEMEFTTGMRVVPVIAPLTGVRAAIRRYCFRLKDAPADQRPDQMTIVRGGGEEAVISTATFPVARLTPIATPPPAASSGYAARKAVAAVPRRLTPVPELATSGGVALAARADPTRALPVPTPLPATSTPVPAGSNGREARPEAERDAPRGNGAQDVAFLPTDPALPRLNDPGEQMQRLEQRFWALLRLLVRKGVITREEFLEEIGDKDE